MFNNDCNNLKYPAIRQFDAVFLNSTAGDLFSDPEVLAGLTRFVREGGGLAGIHGATYASMILPEFSEMIGAADGPHRVEHATIKIDDPASPLTRAFGGKGLTYEDEFYHFLPTGPFSREKLHVLLSLDTEKSDMSTWKVRPDNDYGLGLDPGLWKRPRLQLRARPHAHVVRHARPGHADPRRHAIRARRSGGRRDPERQAVRALARRVAMRERSTV